MSLSRQFSAIGVPPRKNKPRLKRQGAVVGARAMGMGVPMNQPGVLRARGTETKSLDLYDTNYALNQTAVITPLNLMRAGSSFNNRIGRRIEMKSVRITGRLEAVRTCPVEDYIRIMIVYDRQTNGGIPALADIVQDVLEDATTVSSVYSGSALNNRDRFVILRDKRIPVPSLTWTAGVITNPGFDNSTEFGIDMFVKLKGLLTQYRADSAPGVIGDIATGSLLLVTFGGQIAGSEGWRASLTSRLRFNDQ